MANYTGTNLFLFIYSVHAPERYVRGNGPTHYLIALVVADGVLLRPFECDRKK